MDVNNIVLSDFILPEGTGSETTHMNNKTEFQYTDSFNFRVL